MKLNEIADSDLKEEILNTYHNLNDFINGEELDAAMVKLMIENLHDLKNQLNNH
ncbi:hypothetical protein [Acinetobacter sp. TGL-Y2]|uniref:hypothetical protein n=1 Tax=Acinetobacter sp. TGL-Y2 TaxID=1407071 RepID=UPI000A509E20|nr:hypothetical protein [Acinetobacter sp. TGL-Y2]